ncbi:MAG: class I SAM-dependent methyltransferase [Thermoplasmatota archaeon]
MQSKTMYGFPLFTILFHGAMITTLSLFTILSIALYGFSALFLIFFIMLYVYFFVIHFKKTFSKKRFQILQKMIETVDITGSEIILDLGTGAGYIAIGFAKKLDQGTVYGIDKYDLKPNGIFSKLFDVAKINFFGNTISNAKNNALVEKQQNKTEFLEAELTQCFPFKDDSFDVIVSSQFLYCIPQERLSFVLSEINRVLKSDGVLVFFESKRFFNWDFESVIKFFRKKGYENDIFSLDEFKSKVIYRARKPK